MPDSDNVVDLAQWKGFGLESPKPEEHIQPMNGPTREEVTARLEATEARVAMAVESIRGDSTAMRSEMSSHFERLQASQDRFHAQAGKVLAEIELSNEKHKVSIYGIGYKIFAWSFATVLAIAGVAATVYRLFLWKPA